MKQTMHIVVNMLKDEATMRQLWGVNATKKKQGKMSQNQSVNWSCTVQSNISETAAQWDRLCKTIYSDF